MGEAGLAYANQVISLTTDDDFHVRRQAAIALGVFVGDKTLTGKASGALINMLKDNDDRIQVAAMRSLTALGCAKQCAKDLTQLLNSKELPVREAALEAFGSMKEQAASYIQEIAARLDEPMLRAKAINVLVGIGSAAGQYTTEIAAFLGDTDMETRRAAVDAMGRLSNHVDSACVESIAELLTHWNPRYRAAACMALGALGEEKAAAYADQISRLLADTATVGTNIEALPCMCKPNCAAAAAL